MKEAHFLDLPGRNMEEPPSEGGPSSLNHFKSSHKTISLKVEEKN